MLRPTLTNQTKRKTEKRSSEEVDVSQMKKKTSQNFSELNNVFKRTAQTEIS